MQIFWALMLALYFIGTVLIFYCQFRLAKEPFAPAIAWDFTFLWPLILLVCGLTFCVVHIVAFFKKEPR